MNTLKNTVETNKEERAIFKSLKSAQTRSINNAYHQENLSISQACKFVALEKVTIKERDENGKLFETVQFPRLEFIARLELSGIEISPVFTSSDVYNVFKQYGKFTRNYKGEILPILKFSINNVVSAFETQAREIAKGLKLQAKAKAKK
jgi:hypothetical protein